MKRALGVLALVLLASIASAANITVCASGCNHTTVQAAVNAAAAGDVILVRAGETFIGNVTLVDKGAGDQADIIIRSDASAGDLPGAGVRMTPAYAAFLPHLKSANTSPVITVPSGVCDYQLQFLRLGPTRVGYNETVLIGTGDISQDLRSEEPCRITVTQNWITGDPVAGGRVGVSMQGNNITVTHNWCQDYHGVGQDTACFGGYNGSGDWTINNNHVESSGYGFLAGGSDQKIRTFMTVTGSGTTTSAAAAIVDSGHLLNECTSGQLVAIETGVDASGNIRVEFANLTATPAAATTGTLTWTPAVSVAPSVNHRIRCGVVPTNITVTGNHWTRPTKWRTGILTVPSGLTAIASTASGTLAAGEYFYRVQELNPDGYVDIDINSEASATVSATLTATGRVDLAWTDTSGNASSTWRVWRIASAGATTGEWAPNPAGDVTFTDTGSVTWTAGTIPAATKPVTKNLFELKAGINVTISGNVFENHWRGSESGSAIWIKNTNQAGNTWFNETRNILIEDNLIRSVSGCFLFQGRERGVFGATIPNPPFMRDVTVRNNLCYDSNSAYSDGQNRYAIHATNGVINLVMDHNTFIHTMQGAIQLDNAAGVTFSGFVFKNTLIRHEAFGILGSGLGIGNATLNANAPGHVFLNNAIAGANCSVYPATTLCPTNAQWEAQFVSYSATAVGGNFELNPTSAYNNAGTDGADLGADIPAVLTATAGAIVGVTTDPPRITTAVCPNDVAGTSYAGCAIQTSGGTAPVTCAVTSGAVPTGTTFSSTCSTGVSTGTLSAAGTYTFTVVATDDEALESLPVTYVVTIAPAAQITTTTLPAGQIGFTYSEDITVTGDQAPYNCAVTSGSLPTGVVLSAITTGCHVEGPISVAATSTFTVTATGALGSSDPQALSITVAAVQVADAISAPGRMRAVNGSNGRFFVGPNPPVCGVNADGYYDLPKVDDLWMDTTTHVLHRVSATTCANFAGTVTTTPVFATGSSELAGDASMLVNIPADELVGTIDIANLPTDPTFGSVTALEAIAERLTLIENGCSLVGEAGTVVLCASTNHQVLASINGAPFGPLGSSGSSTPRAVTLTFLADGVTSTWSGTLTTGSVGSTGAGEELLDSTRYRQQKDIRGYTQARMVVRTQSVAANAGAVLCVEYSTDGGTTWKGLNGATGTSGICTPFTATNTSYPIAGTTDGGWGTIDTAAQNSDVILSIFAFGGNGTTTPAIGIVGVEWR